MPFSHTAYDSVDQIPDQDWQALTAHDPDITWDRRLIGAFEREMKPDCTCFSIIARDDAGTPTALACAWLFRVDVGNFAWAQKPIMIARKLWPNCLKLGIVFCGLPLPSGQNHLIIAPNADRTQAVNEIHRALRLQAKSRGAMMQVIMAFDDGQCADLSALDRLGYLRGQIPPRHRLNGPYADFADYMGRLKARYRSQVNRSLKKFDAAAFRVEHVLGPVRLPEVYTDEVHKLYQAVFSRSEYKLEYYPANFIRELARQFGDDASLTCIYRDETIAGFTLGIRRGSIYHNLYSGLNYDLREEGDLYFNLFYRDLDFAWKRGATEIHLGQTSDDFKARLGSTIDPLYLYIRPLNGAIRWGMKRFRKLALPAIAKVEVHDVFKSNEEPAKKKGAGLKV